MITEVRPLEETDTQATDPTAIDPKIRVQMQGVERDYQELTTLLVRLPVVPSGELSPELRKEADAYNERRGACTKRFRKIVQPVLAALSKLGDPRVENPTLGDVLAAADGAKLDRVVELEAAAAIATDGGKLAPRCAAELAAIAKQLESDYAETLEAVKEDLTRIGQGIEATIAGAKNGNEAEKQFLFLAKQNVRSRKAFVAFQDAKNRAETMKGISHRCKECGEAIRTKLTQFVSREIRI